MELHPQIVPVTISLSRNIVCCRVTRRDPLRNIITESKCRLLSPSWQLHHLWASKAYPLLLRLCPPHSCACHNTPQCIMGFGSSWVLKNTMDCHRHLLPSRIPDEHGQLALWLCNTVPPKLSYRQVKEARE